MDHEPNWQSARMCPPVKDGAYLIRHRTAKKPMIAQFDTNSGDWSYREIAIYVLDCEWAHLPAD